MIRPLVLLFALAGAPLISQQPALVGAWKVTFPAGGRMENGEFTPIFATGVLTIEPTATSLRATLVTDPVPDLPPRAPVQMTGEIRPDGAVFTGMSVGKVNTNGEEQSITVVSTWTLQVVGDSLKGTIERQAEGLPAGAGQGPQRVTGVRQAH